MEGLLSSQVTCLSSWLCCAREQSEHGKHKALPPPPGISGEEQDMFSKRTGRTGSESVEPSYICR